jgi:predicted PurR-regulated permease PerM
MAEKTEEKEKHHNHNRGRDALFIKRVLVTVGIVLLALALALLLWWGIRVLLVGFAGVLFAVLLRSIALGISKLTRLPVGWSLAVTCLLLVGLFVGLWLLLAPDVIEQTNQLVDRLPKALDKLKERINHTWIGRHLTKLAERLNPMNGAAAPATQAAAKAGSLLATAVNAVVGVLVVLFTGVFLAAQPRLYIDGLSQLFPPATRPRVCQVMDRAGYALRWWLIAQIVDMFIIGLLTWLALWWIGVPLALTLGVLAALFNFIPNFGPLISYVPAVLLAMVESPEKAIWVTVIYIVLQSIEGYILLPLLQREAVDTPPALLILSQVLMTMLVGALGLFLAAPLLAVAMVVVKMLYVHDVLGEGVELPGKHESPRPGGPAL